MAASDPDAIAVAAPFMQRHGEAFLRRVSERDERLQAQFESIDVIDLRATFDACVTRAHGLIGAALALASGSPGQYELVRQ